MQRTWRPDWPCPAHRIMSESRRGAGDPTYRIDPAGRHWRGIRTPDGPAALAVYVESRHGEVQAEAWGEGAAWVLEALPGMLGADDDPSGFVPRHPVLVEAYRRHGTWRVGRTGRVLEALVPAVIEQKVTGQEAFTGYRRLVRRFGEPAPGPCPDLFLQPSAEELGRIASWEWLDLHIDPARSRAIVGVAARAAALERTVDDAPGIVDGKLRSLPGVGVWTSAEVRARAHGDADAVSFGDYHVARDIGWALLGRPIDDEELAELLEPWRGHRLRVQALVAMSGHRMPRRGPRMAARRHLPRPVHGTP